MTTTAPDELPICKGGSGTILPLFNAYGEGEWSTPVQIIVYVVALLWMFLGVGIVADVFMEAIEVITSKDKVVQINGRRVAVKVCAVGPWHPSNADGDAAAECRVYRPGPLSPTPCVLPLTGTLGGSCRSAGLEPDRGQPFADGSGVLGARDHPHRV